MDIGTDSRTQRLSSLAEVLKAYGFSASANEAQRMASDIVKTEIKTQQGFEQKSSSNLTYGYKRGQVKKEPVARSAERQKYYDEHVQRLRANAQEQNSPVHIQTEFQTPKTQHQVLSDSAPIHEPSAMGSPTPKTPQPAPLNVMEHVNTQSQIASPKQEPSPPKQKPKGICAEESVDLSKIFGV